MSPAATSAGILLLALALFMSNRVRHDLVALIALFACLLTGLTAPHAALLGFADPAVIAVAAVLVVGRAIELTGAAAGLARRLIPAAAPFPVQFAVLLGIGAFLSAFMNNIAALVITMPLATQVARRNNLHAGLVLMPLAFATILGGMTTLIGTPANLILSSLREELLGAPMGFFQMTHVAVAVTVVGLLYLSLVGWRLLPMRRGEREARLPWRVFELRAPADMALEGELLPTLRRARARLLALIRDGVRLPPGTSPRAGDRLLLLSRESQWDVAEQTGLGPTAEMGGDPDAVTARVVVAHGSMLIGQIYEAVRARSGGRVRVVAAGPRPARLRQPLDTIAIQAGDQLYIRGSADAIADYLPRARLLEIDRLDPAPLDLRRAGLTVGIFVLAIAATVGGLAPPAITFLGAAVALAGLRLLPPDDIYRSIDWPVIVLLAAMIPVGQSFQASGAADIAAGWLGTALAGATPFVALASLCAGTLLLSIFLNNVATAVIMGPIAIQLAELLGLDPDAALLAVLVGASSDFLTPIGHQNNLLVMGPGGYRFTDYARVGAVLALSTVLTSAAVLSLG